MAGKQKLTREGEPTQRTEKGAEIPVPTRGEFFRALGKVAKKPSGPRKDSPQK